ncbi:MAG: hypothetical protein HY903_19275 [Deltaproteobacteria bacterium]|nr:hypothetical protein [Deltaproteobacteria bacterium]
MKVCRIVAIASVCLVAAACDKALLHEVKPRAAATDTTCAPDAPVDSIEVEVLATHVVVSWASQTGNEDGFIIERRDNEAGDFVEIGRAPVDATSFDNSSIVLGSFYQYRVSAFRVVNNEECKTNPTDALDAVMYPAAITDIQFVHLTTSDLELTFTDGNRRATAYRVERKVQPAVSFSTITDTATPGAVLNDSGLTADQTYAYKVTVLNVKGESAPYEEVVFTSQLPILDWDDPPYVGYGCTLVLRGHTTFDTVAEPDAQYAGASGTVSACAVVDASDSGLSCTLTDLTPGALSVSWSVTDDYQTTGTLQRTLTMNVSPGQRSAAVLPVTSDPGVEGKQAMAGGCGTCTGKRGSIAAGKGHTCLLAADGTVSCWGAPQDADAFSQTADILGTGAPAQFLNPTAVGDGTPPDPWATPLADTQSIARGARHVCAVLASDGSVRCWGNNDYGQLGDGSTAIRGYPVAVCTAGAGPSCTRLTGVTVVAAGDNHTCAVLETSGAVWCWGDNTYGQLGMGVPATSAALVATPVCSTGSARTGDCAPLEDAIDVAAGADFTCAITTGGGFCWGNGGDGQRGDGFPGTTSAAMIFNPEPVCGVAGPGCAGALTATTALAAGANHVCALSSAGTPLCWGRNYDGQLGDGSYIDRGRPGSVCATSSGPCQAPTAVTALAGGDDHSCAIAGPSDAVYCWGSNAYGQLGDGGTVAYSAVPVPVCLSGNAAAGTCVPLTDVAAVVTGASHTCALTSTGGVWCWGSNYEGQLGVGVEYWTLGESYAPLPVCETGAVWDGTKCDLAGSDQRLGSILAIAAGGSYTCAIRSDHTATCWGDSYYGQLGNGSTDDALTPAAVCNTDGCGTNLADVSSLSTAAFHACAVSGTNEIYCWGADAAGQLGPQTSPADPTLPGKVCATGQWDGSACLSGTALAGATSVRVGGDSASNGFSCALTAGATPQCWGDNSTGQLGRGEVPSAAEGVPAPVCATGKPSTSDCAPLAGVGDLALGVGFACARLASDGAVLCWGQNTPSSDVPLLGVSPAAIELGPTPICEQGVGRTCVALSGLATVAAGGRSACAVLSTTEARCWGDNSDGQLGTNDSTDRDLPTPVCLTGQATATDCDVGGTPLASVTAVAMSVPDINSWSGMHACAVVTGGDLFCWGDNDNGELGDTTTSSSASPVQVCADAGCTGWLTGVATVSLVDGRTCGTRTDDSAFCIGENNSGALGRGDDDDVLSGSTTPLPVCGTGSASGGTCVAAAGVDQIVTLAGASCVRFATGGGVACWGDNYYGSVGAAVAGAYTANPTPVCAGGYGATCTRLGDVVSIAAGRSTTCAVLDTGEVRCWGDNAWGVLGTGPDLALAWYFTPQPTPTPVCAVGDWDGSACVGTNAAPLAAVVAVAIGGDDYPPSGNSSAHACALTQGGGVKCWGSNEHGELGSGDGGTDTYGDPLYEANPVDVLFSGSPVAGVVGLTAGAEHNCLLKDDGAVHCWGRNDSGQLGDGEVIDRFYPDVIELPPAKVGLRAVRVVTGGWHSCALLEDATAVCWGLNDYGQVGVGTDTTTIPQPQLVCATGSGGTCVALEDISALAAGKRATCALLLDGTVRCWGSNVWGQLGDGTQGVNDAGAPIADRGRLWPVTVCAPEAAPSCGATHACGAPLQGIVALTGGSAHFCGLAEDGGTYCWGESPTSGERGDGSAGWYDRQCTPTRVCPENAGRCDTGPAYDTAAVQTCDVTSVTVQ